MGILTLLRNAFGRSRKDRAAQAEGAVQETAPPATAPEPKLPSQPAAPTEPAEEPAPSESAQVPEPRREPAAPDEHELVKAAFANVTVPKPTESPDPTPAPASDPTPAPASDPTPASETVAEPTAETEPKPPADAEPVAEVAAETRPEPVDGAKPADEAEPVVEVEPEPDPQPEAESKPDAEPAADASPEPQPEPEIEPEPEPQPERTEPVVEAEPEPKPEAEAEPQTEADPTAPATPGTEPEPATGATTDTRPEPAADTAPEPQPEPEPETAPAAAPAPEPSAADGEPAPQGPPAPDDESSTGGADGNTPAEGEAEAPPKPTTPATPATPAARIRTRAPGLTTAYKAAAAALKKHDLTGTRATVHLVLDRSASMRPYYKDGSAQALAEQTLALAAHLDPEATVHVTFFSTEVDGTGELTLTDHENKIDELHGALGRMGRTSYHAAVEAVLARHEKQAPGTPALVVFQTDGAPDAKTPATQSLTKAAADHPDVHFSFVAFGDPENKAFDYLRKLKTPNTSHFLAGETPKELTDKELYEGVLAAWRP
ncbi:VWA domain-containing protein [Streptomyces sp. MA25(2023)]|uniref:VWA domain-containing protein n=1 Tax=Streptomyces sp. MA25(2023) TaxID=3055078 RepID=UPI0025B18A8D|nr:VWA domain-containing protein [Streptomyces sp. MA25(2023)]MDN3254624.1 VWA domain-containing protein [Streptomyces sp. MA25(2023)]